MDFVVRTLHQDPNPNKATWMKESQESHVRLLRVEQEAESVTIAAQRRDGIGGIHELAIVAEQLGGDVPCLARNRR